MNRRLELHEKLCDILGSRSVYFQPPESVKMNYPAIVYSLNNIENKNADNSTYIQNHNYTVILIDKNPDNLFIDEIAKLPMCKFIRHYRADNLNHYVYSLYF